MYHQADDVYLLVLTTPGKDGRFDEDCNAVIAGVDLRGAFGRSLVGS